MRSLAAVSVGENHVVVTVIDLLDGGGHEAERQGGGGEVPPPALGTLHDVPALPPADVSLGVDVAVHYVTHNPGNSCWGIPTAPDVTECLIFIG